MQILTLQDKLIDDFGSRLKLDMSEDSEEFSFACVKGNNSPISAEEAFKDGQIRTFFNFEYKEKPQAIRKIFIEEEMDPIGPYCSWSGRRNVVEASPERCRKCNSTGFSKLWRFRDLVQRSKSDGKDAFVFLNEKTAKSKEKKMNLRKKGTKGTKGEEKRRSSYLPYKHVGFFTNVNALSRNVHHY